MSRPVLLVQVGSRLPDLYVAHHAPEVGEVIDIRHGDGRVALRVRVARKRRLETGRDLYLVEAE